MIGGAQGFPCPFRNRVGDTACMLGTGPIGLMFITLLKASGAGKLMFPSRLCVTGSWC